MIELADTLPDVNVRPAEYKRLLGYPRDVFMQARSRELAEWAREWYSKNGHPWVYAREVDKFENNGNALLIDSSPFTSARLQHTLSQAGAHSVIVVAVSAGRELEAEAQKLWREEKPDEYFFLEMFGSAVVEHLTTMTGARLCAWAEGHAMAVLPHYSPGYPELDIAEQSTLLDLIRHSQGQTLPGALDVLESGMLRPKKSLLAVFGLTKHTDRLRRITELVPCENCSFAPCDYRRAPYARNQDEVRTPSPEPVTVQSAAKYTINNKALKRWTEERLQLEDREDRSISAVFRYEGTTCTNMGRPLSFHYNVELGPREEGYPIRQQCCVPAPGDDGYTHMCQYINNNPEHLMASIHDEKPLLGHPLNAVLSWPRPFCAAGCYCEPESREHKWGLVLETIHYALAQREKHER